VTFDPYLSKQILQAFLLLEQNQNRSLEAQTRYYQAIGELFIRHGRYYKPFSAVPKNRDMVRNACEYIRYRAAENISVDDVARFVGFSRYHFLRVFKATTGLPPHAYLIQQRLKLARKAIEDGVSLADAALIAGFSDQSHLTRQFKSVYGLTPGRYQSAI
ncbi:MAG: AraC family transcriptional regulator, partial [Desulfobacteraceae bacterium]|jgi:AraC-like DNA-binding protein